MSGAIATVLGIADLASSILGGADGFLIIGNVSFDGVELPDKMPFGGTQSITKHDLPGGTRVIDSMGAFSRDASWSGILYGSDAIVRAQAIDYMRKAGAPVPLSWDVFYYAVVVTDFAADYRNPQYVTYQITCTVLQDMSQPAFVNPVAAVVQAYADIASAYDQISLIVSPPSEPEDDITTAQTSLANNPMIRGSAAYASTLALLQTANTATQGARDTAGAAVDAAQAAAPAGGVVASSSALTAAVANCGVAAGMAAAAGYTGRAVSNATIGAV